MSLLAKIPLLRNVIPPPEYSLRYMDDQERGTLIRSRLLAIGAATSGLVYVVWLFFTVNPLHPWVGGAFIAAETLCLLLFITATFTVWGLRYKPPEGLPIAHASSVDIFITVCGEPLDVIGKTLAAVSAIEWPGRRTVYVLDDGGAVDIETMARERGLLYRSRRHSGETLKAAKAGNLNFGLRQSDGELILVLDADQVPHPLILTSLAGYMRFPDVGFIQSRQLYRVPEGDPFFSLDRVFYQAVQLGYDHRDNAISCGSGVLYRRSALEASGGFASWNLVEDLTTSYELHSRGWRSFYYPYALTVGLAPSDIWSVYRQRSQWALDTMRLFVWDNPLFKRGLRWQSRMSYLVIPFAYFGAGFVFPFLFVIPIWTYLTGSSVLAGSESQFVLLRGLYFVMMAIALRMLFRKQQAGRQFQMLVGLFPVYLLGTFRSLIYPPRRTPRYVPNHAARNGAKRPALVAILPQLSLLAANAVLPFYAIAANSAEPRLILSNAFISAAAIWALLPTIFAALAKKVWTEQETPYGTYRQSAETHT